MARPTVGYAMSLYNQSEWVEEAIESVLRQTVPPDQIVVVDDGSTDDSRERVQALGARNIKLVEVPRKGVSSVLNTAVLHLDTDYVAVQACDDVSMPDRIEMQLEALTINPTTAVFGRPRIIDEVSDEMPDELAPEFFQHAPSSESVLRRLFISGNFLCASSALLHRNTFLRFRGFHPGLLHLQDFRLWIQFASEIEPIVLPDRIVKYRRTSYGGNLSSETNDKRMRAEFAFVYQRFFNDCLQDRLNAVFPEVEGTKSLTAAKIQLLLSHEDHLVYQAGVEHLLAAIEDQPEQTIMFGQKALSASDIFEIVGKSDVDRRGHLIQIANQLRGVAPWLLTESHKVL